MNEENKFTTIQIDMDVKDSLDMLGKKDTYNNLIKLLLHVWKDPRIEKIKNEALNKE